MKIFSLFLMLLLGVSASAQIPQPQKNTYVNDYAQVLSKSDVTQLNQRLFNLEKQKQVQLAIVLVKEVPSAYTINEFAKQIGQKWHVGKNQRGIVYVAAIAQRKQYITFARKLGSTFSGEKSQNILTAMKPAFKEKNYAEGLGVLVEKVGAELPTVASEAEPRQRAALQNDTPAAAQDQKKEQGSGFPWMALLIVGGIIILIVWIVRRNNQRKQAQFNQPFNQNNPNDNNPYNPGNPGGYNNPGYGNYPPYNTPQQGSGSTLRDMATGAIIGGALGYGARAMQDRAADNEHNRLDDQNNDRNNLTNNDQRQENEPSNWGNWGGGNENDGGSYDSSSDFTDDSWSDSDSGFSDDGGAGDSFDSGGDDGGSSSDW